ncbi:MAG: TIGR00730 family Rossman fold protein [Bacteroidia bacterium]
MKSIAVFCGSSKGNDPIYTKVANELGKYLAQQKIGLVYGGGNIGLMGIIADAVLQSGGKVTGVIPHFLMKKEVGHTGLTELILVDTMHQRKQIMCDRADAFITMPGGFGSMDELFEILTWKQLGLHNKPIGVLNVNGYYDHLVALINHMNCEQFVPDKTKELVIIDDSIEGLMAKLLSH